MPPINNKPTMTVGMMNFLFIAVYLYYFDKTIFGTLFIYAKIANYLKCRKVFESINLHNAKISTFTNFLNKIKKDFLIFAEIQSAL